jgi:hypothetical protein
MGQQMSHRFPYMVEPIRHIPIAALRGPALIVQRQPHQSENRLVDLVVIDLHAGSLPHCAPEFRSYRRLLITQISEAERQRLRDRPLS